MINPRQTKSISYHLPQYSRCPLGKFSFLSLCLIHPFPQYSWLFTTVFHSQLFCVSSQKLHPSHKYISSFMTENVKRQETSGVQDGQPNTSLRAEITKTCINITERYRSGTIIKVSTKLSCGNTVEGTVRVTEVLVHRRWPMRMNWCWSSAWLTHHPFLEIWSDAAYSVQ
jgi:hypothetical protein